ncbi:MAG: esterase-like activity of phytase family protein [Pseudomonadota bacterium]
MSFPIASQEIGEPWRLSKTHDIGDQYMKVRLLGALKLNSDIEVNGYAAHEISGLAWDSDEQMLYAVSDDGFILHLQPKFADDRLTAVAFANAYPLTDAHGEILKDSAADAEGLTLTGGDNAISGDTTLWVSFERQPRIAQYSPAGRHIGAHPIPATLKNTANYAQDNTELESLEFTEQFGPVFAPERPLKGARKDRIEIYNQQGAVAHYPLFEAKNSSLVGLTATPNGNLIALERRYSSMFAPKIWSLRHLEIGPDGTGKVTDFARFQYGKWKIDNFEAVAHHQDNKYFLATDDNESSFQKSLLVYLEIVDIPAEGATAR